MESRKVVFDYVQSEGSGSVEQLARTLANNGYRNHCSGGWRRLINDVLSMVLWVLQPKTRRRIVALGIIPNGIGNDFAKILGIG